MRLTARKHQPLLPSPHQCSLLKHLSRQREQPCPPRHQRQLPLRPKQKHLCPPQRLPQPRLKRLHRSQPTHQQPPQPPRQHLFRSPLRPQLRPPAACQEIHWRSPAAATTAVLCSPPANTLPIPTAATAASRWTWPTGRWPQWWLRALPCSRSAVRMSKTALST